MLHILSVYLLLFLCRKVKEHSSVSRESCIKKSKMHENETNIFTIKMEMNSTGH